MWITEGLRRDRFQKSDRRPLGEPIMRVAQGQNMSPRRVIFRVESGDGGKREQGNSGRKSRQGSGNPAETGRAADRQSEHRDFRNLARQGYRRAQGKDRVASCRHLQRRALQGRRAISEEGRQGFIEGALQTRKWTDQSGVEKYSTEVVLQGFNSTLTMLDGRSGGGGGRFGSDDSGGDFGSGGPVSSAPRRAVAAGGRNSDMDDDIPFLA